MPLQGTAVGARLGPITSHLTKRRTMAYAAGVPDLNPAYLDDVRPDGIVAHPLFPVTLEWGLRGALIEALGVSPEEAGHVVHATHDLTLHRPLRPGDALTTTGTIVGVEARPPGAYVLVRYETRVPARGCADGVPVATTYHGSIFRGVGIAGEARALAGAPPLPERPHDPGTEAWVAELAVDRGLPHRYTECSGIWNPIHTERAYALGVGLPDIILHGTQTLALAIREVVARGAGGDPGRLRRVACRFGSMVVPDTTIRVLGRAHRGSDGQTVVAFTVENAAGQPAIRDGVAVLAG